MTTTVTVRTHDWPVEVTIIDEWDERDLTETKEIIKPMAEWSSYLTQNRSIKLKELPKPE